MNSDGYALKSQNEAILSAGDVVISWCENGHSPYRPHIMLCGGYDSGGYATFYAHNSAQHNQRIPASSGKCGTCGRKNGQIRAKVLHLGNSDKCPVGYLDSVECVGEGKIKVKGWAYDPDRSSSTINVHIYIGGGAGTTGAECHVVTANKSYPSVNSVMGVSGDHGFEAVISTSKSGSQKICAYGIDITQIGNNKELYQSGVTVSITADTQKPTISNVKVSNITTTGYTIECDITDNVGVDRVEFPTWPSYKGSTGCTWYKPTFVSGNHYTFRVPISDFNNYTGTYQTHIYAWDKSGLRTSNSGKMVTLPQNSVKSIAYNGHTYEMYNSNVGWKDARDIAQSKGGHLVTINSSEEKTFIDSFISDGGNSAYWIGGTDEASEGTFTWVTGESFTKYGSGSFDNAGGNEHYLGVWLPSFNWNDFPDTYYLTNKIGYVVEYEDAVTKVYGSYNDHEYMVCNDGVTYSEALALQTDGWHLATITSQGENDYIVSLIRQFTVHNGESGYWLGANNLNENGTYEWITGEEFSYTNWYATEPSGNWYNGGYEHHLGIYHFEDKIGQWNDYYEGRKLGYVLEKGQIPNKENEQEESQDPQQDTNPQIVEMKTISIASDRNASINVYEGDSFKLTATITPSNATEQTVIWKSSNSDYASVDNDGNVSVTESTNERRIAVDITASNQSGTVSDTYSITIYPRSGYLNNKQTVSYNVDPNSSLMTISGIGAIGTISTTIPIKNKDVKKVVIEDGITNIASYMFYGSHLSELELPNSITDIGDKAFIWMNSTIDTISIPSSIETMASQAFNTCRVNKIIFNSNAPEIYGDEDMIVSPEVHVPVDAVGFEDWPCAIIYDQPAISESSTPDELGFVEIPDETDLTIEDNQESSDSSVINTNSNPSTQNNTTPSAVTNNTNNNSANKTTSNNASKKITYKNEWVKGLWYDANGNNSYSAKLYWRSNSKGWYVEDSNRWYPQSQWQKINSVWYYFNSSGYMASGEWYNGYWFNTDGSWTYKEKATWKNDGTGWWYGDTSGWYAQNCWQKIDGDWYYFNSSGYMATSQYIGGWWVGADGVCR
ncbi:MAG: leucine-rich repeat protein [Eubacterium sp.]|nr:leucine-rich repeat protein [Eubacterium sp.]